MAIFFVLFVRFSLMVAFFLLWLLGLFLGFALAHFELAIFFAYVLDRLASMGTESTHWRRETSK
jgi:hypothetical protein